MINANIKRAVGLGVAILTLSAGSAFAAVTTDTSVNVMAGPGSHFHTVARLAAGADVSITATDKAWCKIAAPGAAGWIPCNDVNGTKAKPVASITTPMSSGWHGYDYNADPLFGPNGGQHTLYNGEFKLASVGAVRRR